MIISLSFKFLLSLSCLKNDVTLLEFIRMRKYLGSLITYLVCSFDDKSLCFKFHKNLSCVKMSRILLKNDDTLLELGGHGGSLLGLGSLITF